MAIFGSHFAFWASVPKWAMYGTARSSWIPTAPASAEPWPQPMSSSFTTLRKR